MKRFLISSSAIQLARSATGLPGPLHGHPPPLRRGGLGAPERGGWMKRYPTDTPTLCGLRGEGFVRSPFRAGLALPFPAGRWRGWFTMMCRRRGKGASISPRSPSRWDQGPGGKPGPTPWGARRGAVWEEGRRETSSGIRASSNVRRNSPSHVGGRAPGRLLRCGLWAALSWLRPRPGHRGTNQGPVLPGPPGGPQ